MDEAHERATSTLDAPPVIENPTDAELVEAARTGDAFAVTRLWQRHLAAVWAAARATAGRDDAEPIVVRTAERLIAELREGRGPTGAVRPHLLALTRHAVVEEQPAAASPEGVATGSDTVTGGVGGALETAPAETYADLLPEGMGDAHAAVAAFAALPTRWQEALWSAEVDGLAPAELAAELGLDLDAAASMLADARAGLRAEWSALHAAALPDDSACRSAAAASAPERRAHLGACAGCRVVAGPPDVVSSRALATLPLALLGAGGGLAYLESIRRGASAAATEPIPPLEPAGAGAAGATGESRTLGIAPIRAARGGSPRYRRTVAVLAGVAACSALVAGLIAGTGGARDVSMFFALPGGDTDLAAPAPDGMSPVIIATQVPDAPEADAVPDDPDAPDAPDAGGSPDAADGPTATSAPAPSEPASGGTDGTPEPSPVDEPAPAAPAPAQPSPTQPAKPEDAGDSRAPDLPDQADQADTRTPLTADAGSAGPDGWRTLSVSGAPDATFTVSNDGGVLYTGRLDRNGAASLKMRGGPADVDSLDLAYGAAASSKAAATAETRLIPDTARRGRSSVPTP